MFINLKLIYVIQTQIRDIYQEIARPINLDNHLSILYAAYITSPIMDKDLTFNILKLNALCTTILVAYCICGGE